MKKLSLTDIEKLRARLEIGLCNYPIMVTSSSQASADAVKKEAVLFIRRQIKDIEVEMMAGVWK